MDEGEIELVEKLTSKILKKLRTDGFGLEQ